MAKRMDHISIHLESIAICKAFSVEIFITFQARTVKCESNELKSWFNLHKEELKCKIHESEWGWVSF